MSARVRYHVGMTTTPRIRLARAAGVRQHLSRRGLGGFVSQGAYGVTVIAHAADVDAIRAALTDGTWRLADLPERPTASGSVTFYVLAREARLPEHSR